MLTDFFGKEILVKNDEINYMQLNNMTIGSRGRIVGIKAGNKAYRHRLIALGLIPGSEFILSRIAPLGDPVEIWVRGFALSLRKKEAEILQIESITA